MPFCTSCGKEIEPGFAFCANCGSAIRKPTQTMTGVNIQDTPGTSKGDNESVFLDDEVQTQILEIVKKASKSIMFVSPYIDLWGHLKNEMENARDRGVVITFVVRAEEKNPPGRLKWIREHNETKQHEQLKWLREHNVKVDHVERLHAKIYLNERTVLVSSMNITDTSTTNSREFAMIVRSDDDVKKFRDYVAQLTGKTNASQTVPTARCAGFCIRDGSSMNFNTSRPLCDKCYPKWVKFENKNYGEKYCHSCGKQSETTYARPVCHDCYQKLN